VAEPAEIALTDQARAAEREAREALARSATARGGTIERGDVSGGHARILARLAERVRSGGQLSTCPHISVTRPGRQFWVAWLPDDITCGPCTKAKLSDEQQPCDVCGSVPAHIVVLQLPAMVDGPRLVAVGPTTVMTALCGPCDGGQPAS
jgi:hypothetical protein